MHTLQRLDQDFLDFPGVSLRGFSVGLEFPSWLSLALQDNTWMERSRAGKAYARLIRRCRYYTRIPEVFGNNSTRLVYPWASALPRILDPFSLLDSRTAAGLTHRGSLSYLSQILAHSP